MCMCPSSLCVGSGQGLWDPDATALFAVDRCLDEMREGRVVVRWWQKRDGD